MTMEILEGIQAVLAFCVLEYFLCRCLWRYMKTTQWLGKTTTIIENRIARMIKKQEYMPHTDMVKQEEKIFDLYGNGVITRHEMRMSLYLLWEKSYPFAYLIRKHRDTLTVE